MDGFMPICSLEKVICESCYHQNYGRVKCGKCGGYSRCNLIRGRFFEKIEREVCQIREKERGGDMGQRNGNEENGGGVRMEENLVVWKGTGAWSMLRTVKEALRVHVHAGSCKPYTGLKYMCISVTKMVREIGAQKVTINDVLAFQCMFCGHGDTDQIGKLGEGGRQLSHHRMQECREKCCGDFLDRRYLQYLGGNCECGIMIMEMMGITPANEEQNGWRKKLYDGRRHGIQKEEVWDMLGVTFRKMKLHKPFMLVWYIMSQGGELLSRLIRWKEAERMGEIGKIVQRLNGEYGKHTPIQWEYDR